MLPSDQDKSGRDLGPEELELLRQVLDSGVLTSTKGTMVRELEKEFADLYSVRHCIAVASGTAAVHAALAAVELRPGDEVVTSAVTDMGAITPILFQGGVPVFADVDPESYGLTAETLAPRMTQRTRAVVVTHLFGYPCEMEAIVRLCGERGVAVIEDCAQSYLAESRGRLTGTWGELGAFSMQQGKHMTTGEGGLVVTDDPERARRVRLFVNKAWGYGDPKPDHYFAAPNYRLTELQGAVARAQLRKLPGVVERRRRAAERMDRAVAGLSGVRAPRPPAGTTHSYWKYVLDVDPDAAGIDVGGIAERLREHDIASAPRYIQKPAFRCEVLREGRVLGGEPGPLPAESLALGRDEARCRAEYPNTYRALSRMLVLPWNEFYTDEHVDFVAGRLADALSG